MERILIVFETLVNQEKHNLYICLNQRVCDFETTLIQDDNIYTYEHFFYLLEEHTCLDKSLSWKENNVLSGDHIFYI